MQRFLAQWFPRQKASQHTSTRNAYRPAWYFGFDHGEARRWDAYLAPLYFGNHQTQAQEPAEAPAPAQAQVQVQIQIHAQAQAQVQAQVEAQVQPQVQALAQAVGTRERRNGNETDRDSTWDHEINEEGLGGSVREDSTVQRSVSGENVQENEVEEKVSEHVGSSTATHEGSMSEEVGPEEIVSDHGSHGRNMNGSTFDRPSTIRNDVATWGSAKSENDTDSGYDSPSTVYSPLQFASPESRSPKDTDSTDSVEPFDSHDPAADAYQLAPDSTDIAPDVNATPRSIQETFPSQLDPEPNQHTALQTGVAQDTPHDASAHASPEFRQVDFGNGVPELVVRNTNVPDTSGLPRNASHRGGRLEDPTVMDRTYDDGIQIIGNSVSYGDIRWQGGAARLDVTGGTDSDARAPDLTSPVEVKAAC